MCVTLTVCVCVCVFVSQGTSLLVEKAVKIGSSNYHFVTTDLVVIKMGKSAFDKIVHACFGKSPSLSLKMAGLKCT